MNARQKAKYYKRKYEELSNARIKPTIIYQSPLQQYQVMKSRMFPVECDEDFIHHKLAVDISEELINFIDNKIRVSNRKNDPDIIPDGYKEVRANFDFWYR